MHRYITFGVVSLGLFLFSVSHTTVSVAFPAMISELNASLVLAGWVLSVNQLVGISIMPIAAKVSEVFGNKRTFMVCTFLFTLGSALCAIAPNVEWLIVFRMVQALGGGGFLPSATGIVSDEFPEMRQRVIGFFTSIFPIGAIVGPNLGGWMVASMGWKSVFWFNVPLGLLVLVFSWRLLRTDSGNGSGGSIDLVGAGLLTSFLAALMLALSEVGNKSGVSWTLVSFLIVLSVSSLIALIFWELRAKEPIVDFELLKGRPFLAANIYNLAYGACAFGIFSFIPLYAVSTYGMGTFESGLILTPRSVAMMIASTVTSFYLIRWGYRRPILVGTLIVIFSLLLIAFEHQGVNFWGIRLSPMVVLLVILTISGLGVGISAPAANNACIELMPAKVATITGIRGMFRQLGGVLSITITSLLLETVTDMSRAFTIAFVGLALLLLLTIPTVFAMPSNPNVKVPFQNSQRKGL